MNKSVSVLFFFSVLYTATLVAQNQVGINTTNPHSSSVLEAFSNNKGVLIPRMTSVQRRNIVSPADGLWVYETNTNSYWYSVSGNWVEFVSGGGLLDGIGDSDADTRIFAEFTLDNDQLRFYLAGPEIYRYRVGRIDVLNTGNTILWGQESGLNDDLSDNRNVFLGRSAGRSNSVGSRNVAIGYQSMLNLSIENDNVATGNRSSEAISDVRRTVSIGSEAMLSNASSDNHTAIGYRALQQHFDRFNNTVVGNSSMSSSTNGRSAAAMGNRTLQSGANQSFNVAIGTEAGNEVNNNRGIYIGYLSGSQTTAGNRLYIENSASNTPLIFANFSNDVVIINGDINVSQDITYVGNLTDVSDRRLKKGIRPLEKQLNKLKQLNAYEYTLIDGNGELEFGFMADEVQSLYPEAVKIIDQENTLLGVEYFQLLAPLQQGIREQGEQLMINGKQLCDLELNVQRLNEKLKKLKTLQIKEVTSMK
ncbi:MAG: hypothetical protein CMO34_05670 [Verrucomicrobia bacterium]|nr:hypothetical protein [Verrucomicrobiota bacterium]